MTLIDPPDVLEQGRVGKSPIARIGGTGSISTLGIPEDEAREAEERRVPFGFRAPEYPSRFRILTPLFEARSAQADQAMDSFSAQVERLARERLYAESAAVERELRDLGECLWTARDTITIRSDALGVGDAQVLGVRVRSCEAS